MSINDYGALLIVDGVFVNKFKNRYMSPPTSVPDHGFYIGAPRVIDASEEFPDLDLARTFQYQRKTRKEDLNIELFLDRLCEDTLEDRFFLSFFATDPGGKKHNYIIIFGYGITPEEFEWERNLNDDTYNFTESEKNEIRRWFK